MVESMFTFKILSAEYDNRLPWMMLVPLTLAYLVCKQTMMDEFGSETKAQVIWAGYLRTLCMIAILFVPMHYGQCLQPFDCQTPVGAGYKAKPTMRAAQNVVCEDVGGDYSIIYRVSIAGIINIVAVFIFLNYCVRKAFWWQMANKVFSSHIMWLSVWSVNFSNNKISDSVAKMR